METVQKGGKVRPRGTPILMHGGEKATSEQNTDRKSQEVALSRSPHESGTSGRPVIKTVEQSRAALTISENSDCRGPRVAGGGSEAETGDV